MAIHFPPASKNGKNLGHDRTEIRSAQTISAAAFKRRRTPKVALMIETSNGYGRGLLAGVTAYLRTYGPLNVHVVAQGHGDRLPKWIEEWDGDGILARVENRAIARALAGLRTPVVDLSAFRYLPGAPVVTTDDALIAQRAFRHFTDRAFRRFAYCGESRSSSSLARSGHFDQLTRDAGFTCAHYKATGYFRPDSNVETKAIAEWLSSLPKPVAVFTTNDARGLQVLEACRQRNFSVPDQVAVLGVDNDDLLCDLSTPSLSSIQLDTHRSGWLAAELLMRMIGGESIAAGIHRVPPLEVCTRKSTDVTAVEDMHVARAGRYIREYAAEGINVQDVVDTVGLARRVLERRFLAAVGRTLHEEIRRVQTQRIKDLLLNTELSLKDVAERTGFRYVEYLTVAFKRETGQPPSVYRNNHRTSSNGDHGGPLKFGESTSAVARRS